MLSACVRFLDHPAFRRFASTVTLAAIACCTPCLSAADWPHWRGPAFNGSSTDTGLPESLDPQSNLAWKAPLPGPSSGTPIIMGDRIFVGSLDAGKNLLLLCFHRKDGSKAWEQSVGLGPAVSGRNNTASPSPVTDGQRVFALFGTGDLAAFDVDGHKLWARNLGQEYGKFALMWIYGSSPVLYDGRLYVQVLQRNPRPNDYAHALGDAPERESYLLCIDPATGRNLWRHVRKTDSTKESQEAYTTPFPYEGRGRRELIVVGGDHLSGHDLATGREFWRGRLYEKRDDWYRIVASPVAADGLIYASGPKGQPMVAFREGGEGDITSSHLAWSARDGQTDWSSPLLYRGRMFVVDGAHKMLTCLDPKTGEKKWAGSLPTADTVWASPTAADGRIYVVSERGTLMVFGAGEEFRLLSQTQLGEEPIRSSVAVAHGHAFVRSPTALYCFGSR
jgi:outer membrane protein assembly factor BamB